MYIHTYIKLASAGDISPLFSCHSLRLLRVFIFGLSNPYLSSLSEHPQLVWSLMQNLFGHRKEQNDRQIVHSTYDGSFPSPLASPSYERFPDKTPMKRQKLSQRSRQRYRVASNAIGVDRLRKAIQLVDRSA